MINKIANGKVLDYLIPAATEITSGQLLHIGSLVGVAVTGGTAGETIAVNLTGVYELTKVAGAITIGAKVYKDADTGNMTVTASGNLFVGYAYKAAESADTTVLVMIGARDITETAANVAAMAASTDLTAVPESFADLAAVQTYLNTMVPIAETRLDNLQTKVNAILTALKGAKLMTADS